MTAIEILANIFPVFRFPTIFLLTTYLSLGPTLFERIHLAEVNQALARISAPKVAGKTPLKRLPDKTPAHDPATCPICIVLHAPIAGQFTPAPSFQPIDQLGLIAPHNSSGFDVLLITSQQCRGPPASA